MGIGPSQVPSVTQDNLKQHTKMLRAGFEPATHVSISSKTVRAWQRSVWMLSHTTRWHIVAWLLVAQSVGLPSPAVVWTTRAIHRSSGEWGFFLHHPIQNGFRDNSAFQPMGARSSFPKSTAAEVYGWRLYLPPSAESRDRTWLTYTRSQHGIDSGQRQSDGVAGCTVVIRGHSH
jgi:hypothetical protein